LQIAALYYKKIYGHVYDKNTNKPISGVTVKALNNSTITDSDGYYSIDGFSSGYATLIGFNKTGYKQKTDTVYGIGNIKHDTYLTPITECNEGETKCVGYDLYKCINGKWQLVETNSSQCGYTPPPPPIPKAKITNIDIPSTFKPNKSFNIRATVKNIGNTNGKLFCQIRDTDANKIIGSRKTVTLSPNSIYTFTWTITVSKTSALHGRIEAGHEALEL